MKPVAAILMLAWSSCAFATPLADPGDLRLRHDLQLLNDAGVVDIPLTAWPVSLPDVLAGIETAGAVQSPMIRAALERVRNEVGSQLEDRDPRFRIDLAGAIEPRFIRSFESMPRDEGEVSASFEYIGERFAVRLSATAVANPFDGDDFRPDGSWVGAALGNWMLTAGWQDRWWGPGRDGSLILSTNSRPAPGIMLQRNLSRPFKTRWLSWLGPWTFTTFMSQLDDERVVNDALLFGARGSFRPPRTGLEIGISRTAQWCGDDRPCDLEVFGDLLLGNDNQGVNVEPDREPGNQLGGFDIRWRLPKQIPVAMYLQWIGEDGRGGGGAIGSWLRQAGLEAWGSSTSFSHRTHVEISDSRCRAGGSGFSNRIPNCAYEHSIYQTGYRYQGRALGYSGDGNTLSYSAGSTLVQSAGHTWNLLLRHMKINRDGGPNERHTISSIPVTLSDFQVTHERILKSGRLHFGLSVSRLEDELNATRTTDTGAFIKWSSR